MSDEDKTFSGSFVLDLRIWWRQAHTLYKMKDAAVWNDRNKTIETWIKCKNTRGREEFGDAINRRLGTRDIFKKTKWRRSIDNMIEITSRSFAEGL